MEDYPVASDLNELDGLWRQIAFREQRHPYMWIWYLKHSQECAFPSLRDAGVYVSVCKRNPGGVMILLAARVPDSARTSFRRHPGLAKLEESRV